MRAVTDPSYPAAIWRSLQLRNRITQHRGIQIGDVVDFHLSMGELRFFEKGAEADLLLKAFKNDELIWQSCTTFYYRGRYTPSHKKSDGIPETAPPSESNTRILKMPSSGRLRFGGWSGDINGIHLFDTYARLMGYPSAFLHPHRVIGHLFGAYPNPKGDAPHVLDLWFRGPVFYGAQTRVTKRQNLNQEILALYLWNDPRPAMVARREFL